ncbi:class II aldolase/adducin family protein [Mycobacterium sp. URHB0044]|uniref:class II aldolase/adducin family protein n=1 Tax=Mycobacterium sp. URHB0044 TaxID=1380386 RepID=UPI00048B3C84|nr:class II aldolase/adducin family protein [Mycobacterium sp. URHB0044]
MTAVAETPGLTGLRETVALACRMLAHQGLVADVLGHVSVRIDSDRILLRCRGTEDRGLLFTAVEDVRVIDRDDASDPGDGYSVPNESHIHTELYRSRPDVNAVVHVHPRDLLVCDLAGIELREVFGAYNIPASRLAQRGVPVYPRPVLVRTPELGRELAEAIGDGDVCILRGHGLVSVGETVPQATLRALDLAELSRIAAEVAMLGAHPPELSDRDRRELPDLGSSFNDLSRWRHYLGRLQLAGLAL